MPCISDLDSSWQESSVFPTAERSESRAPSWTTNITEYQFPCTQHSSTWPPRIPPPPPHARVPPPTIGRIAMHSPWSIPTPLTRASPASSSRNSGPPASPTPTLVLAVDVEHVFCAPNHASRERHAQGTAAGRGYRMGFGRGNAPQTENWPRGGQQRPSETVATIHPDVARAHGACAPWPTPTAVRAGANYAPAQTAVFASLRPPEGGASPPPCSNVRSHTGDKKGQQGEELFRLMMEEKPA